MCYSLHESNSDRGKELTHRDSYGGRSTGCKTNNNWTKKRIEKQTFSEKRRMEGVPSVRKFSATGESSGRRKEIHFGVSL